MGATESVETHGWRILEVIPNGPCWNKNLCVYFDFIVGVNGNRLTTSSEQFWDLIRSQQDKEIILTIFNYKTRIKRDIEVIPTNNWNGDGLLGLVIVGQDFTKCDEQCIRVLSVDNNSPAFRAGLEALNDYILGTPINAFTSFSIFRDTISDYIDQPLPIYVYNTTKAQVRLVEIKPASTYAGDGVLGCQVGDGYLHHIPSLTEKQSNISFKPVASYIVSSRNSQKHHHDHTNVESKLEEQKIEESNTNIIDQENKQNILNSTTTENKINDDNVDEIINNKTQINDNKQTQQQIDSNENILQPQQPQQPQQQSQSQATVVNNYGDQQIYHQQQHEQSLLEKLERETQIALTQQAQ